MEPTQKGTDPQAVSHGSVNPAESYTFLEECTLLLEVGEENLTSTQLWGVADAEARE